MVAMMPLIVTAGTFVVPSKDWPFSSHGWLADADVVTVNVFPPGPVQVSRVTDENDARGRRGAVADRT